MYPKTIGDWIFGYPCDGLSWLLRQWVSLQHVLSCGCPGESVTERVYGMDQRGVSRCTLHRVSCESRFAQYRFNPFCFSVLPRELLQVVTLVKLRVGSLKCALFFRNLIRHLYSIHFRCHTETSSDLYWAYQTRYRIPSLLHPTSSIIPIEQILDHRKHIKHLVDSGSLESDLAAIILPPTWSMPRNPIRSRRTGPSTISPAVGIYSIPYHSSYPTYTGYQFSYPSYGYGTTYLSYGIPNGYTTNPAVVLPPAAGSALLEDVHRNKRQRTWAQYLLYIRITFFLALLSLAYQRYWVFFCFHFCITC